MLLLRIIGGILGIVFILALLYLVMIMPNLRHKPQEEEFRKWLYAHRGLHDNTSDAPENSLAAFRKAVEAGYGIEMDIQLTKDKMPVVFHDFTLNRICGVEGKVRDYTYEELQQFRLCNTEERIPRLVDALNVVGGKVPLIVEFKIETMDISLCPIADKLLKKYTGLYCMESFHPQAVRWYRMKRPEVVRGQLSDAFIKSGEFHGPISFVLQNLMFNFWTKPDFIAYNCQFQGMLARKICRGFYHNMSAAWTVKSKEQLEEMRNHFDIFIFDSFVPRKKEK